MRREQRTDFLSPWSEHPGGEGKSRVEEDARV